MPGTAADGAPLYGSVNGTSAAAATVAGAAALLAQVRPALDGPALRSLLAGYAQRGRASALAVGNGVFGSARRRSARSRRRRRRSASGSGAARAGTRRGPSSSATSRRGGSSVSLKAAVDGDSEALQFTVQPSHFVLRSGRVAHRVR